LSASFFGIAVNLHDLVSQLIIDTKGTASGTLFSAPAADSSLAAIAPELILCATILVLLLVRTFKGGERVDTFWIAAIGSALAFYYAAPWRLLSGGAGMERMEIFTGMLVYDGFSVFIRSALLLFAFLFALFTRLSGLPNREDGPDIYTLVLGATIGMCLMASANHLLMVFMGVEMASVPSYALAGMLKGRKSSSEAALKYAVYGAGAAGVMLYGISLIAGLLNTAHLPTIAWELARRFGEFQSGEVMVLALGGLMVGVGLAFKLSAVPFHYWAPDVFEGATAEVGAFLSISSKAAALALLVRVAVGMGTVAPEAKLPGWETVGPTQAITSTNKGVEDSTVAFKPQLWDGKTSFVADETSPSDAPVSTEGANKSLSPVRSFAAQVIIFLAILTCTFGNLAAYGQTNMKRLLAYSTIAHAGYMMMPVAAAVAVAGYDPERARRAIAALGIYVIIYLFMNLGAFAIVAFLRNAMRSEEIADYAGLIKRAPGTVVCMCIILFSLIGLPPMAGFIGKFAIFAELVRSYNVTVENNQPANYLMIALVVGGINTAISLFYYLRVAKVMTIDDEPRDRPPFAFSDVSLPGAFVWLVTLPTALLMLSWDSLSQMAQTAARYLFA
jgi:NADH-quinone oxidoreductase subunit N